ncbi:hypothetical protein Bca101_067091 [Brassica carinata]
MVKSKAGGGPGFRDIHLFNQAFLAKQAWRILTRPYCLLARILLGKYCLKQSFLEIQLPAVCSHGWRSILHGRDLLIGNVGKAIGNGEDTKVWKDAWISLEDNVKNYGPIPEEGLDLRVSDLTHFGTKMEREQTEEEIWRDSCSPKMRMFLWTAAQNALPVGANLQQRGIQPDETRNTLLFEETPSVEEVASKALRLAQEWTLAQGLKQQSYKPAEKQNEEMRNRIDQSAYTICKTDASWEKHSKRAGLAWIITAPTGTTISKESIIQTSVNSPLIAEALALRSGLLTAVAKGITNLLMLTDNSTFVRAINNDMKSPEIYVIAKDIQFISSDFVDIVFRHLSRSLNGEADALAKATLSPSFVLDPVLG